MTLRPDERLNQLRMLKHLRSAERGIWLAVVMMVISAAAQVTALVLKYWQP
jgi:hypothetical protein